MIAVKLGAADAPLFDGYPSLTVTEYVSMALRRLLPLLLFVLAGCTATNRKYYSADAEGGYFGDHLSCYLGSAGEPYNQRGDFIADAGVLKPSPGESYDQFQGRILNTLSLQEYDIKNLEDSISNTNKQVNSLKQQLKQLEQQNSDLRSDLKGIKTQAISAAAKAPGDTAAFERYVVRKGDTLEKIAKNKYGVYNGWLAIYRFNQDRLPNGPNRIAEGQVIVIPPRSA